MITIETTAQVTSDGTVTIQLPPTVLPGVHRIVVVIEQQAKPDTSDPERLSGWHTLEQLIDECGVDTGIEDLAHQHDHYLHGTPKREV